jgi:conjugative relaxase-like TrwC/TraI family protein
MLGLHRLTTTGADYYLADLAGELPLPPHWDARGHAGWIGQASSGLGVEGAVDPAHLAAVLDGRHPAGRSRLRSDRAAVRGFDLTFSAPKSVSVVFALAGEDAARRVLAAHHDAVRGAVAYVESHSLSAQRGSGEQRRVVPTTGLVGAWFTHGVNRNLDPHVHTHVVVANMVHGVDGRWSACDHRGLSAHRRAAAAVYDAHLRAELTGHLGVRWVAAPGLRAEVGGVSPLLLGEFSSRSADIRRHMAEWGARSRRGASVAWAATRPEKQVGLDFGALSAQWERRARAVGNPAAEMAAVLAHRAPHSAAASLDEHRFRAVLSLSPDGAARRRDVVAALGTGAVNGVQAPRLERLADLWAPTVARHEQIGVAEDVQPLRAVVPGDHLVAALGPRPLDPDAHVVWRDAARAVEQYRLRWRVKDGADALGVDRRRVAISSLPTDRLVHHLQTERHVETARQRLGQRAARGLEMERGR